MQIRTAMAAAAACTLLLGLSACGSDDQDSASGGGGGSDSSGSGGARTLTVGLLSSYSGAVAASKGGKSEVGFNARMDAYKADGGECADTTVNLVTADDTSTPQGALTAFQQLAQQQNPYVILDDSQFFYAAAPFATTQATSIPVLGVATDGAQQWQSADNNLFPALPVPLPGTVFSTTGEFFKNQGATKVAGIAFQSPSSQQSLEDVLSSTDAAGLQRGYVNNTVPFGSADVGSIVLGIMNSGADALYLPINSDTIVAIAEALKQANYPVKAILAATGYGATLLADPAAVSASQGQYYSTSIAPIELHSDATDKLQSALQDAGVQGGVPDLDHALGWSLADLLIHGLELAGCDATQQQFMDALRSDTTWDDGGLYSKPFDFSDPTDLGQNCGYYVQLEGNEFKPVEGASPLCGDRISS